MSASFDCFFFDPPGVSLVQRHHQAVRRASRAGQTVQAVRHEEVPAERQQGDEEAVPGEEQAGDSGEKYN